MVWADDNHHKKKGGKVINKMTVNGNIKRNSSKQRIATKVDPQLPEKYKNTTRGK